MKDEGELPEGWTAARLGDILSEPLRNGHSAKASTDGRGVRAITLTAVTYGDFSERNTKITCADPDRVRDLWLQPGDILIERSNTPELVGTARLYRGAGNFAIFPDLVIRARVDAKVLPEFVELALNAPSGRTYLTGLAQGTAGSMPKIDQGTVEQFPLTLPSRNEQERIVGAVGRMRGPTDRIRERLANALVTARRFRKAVLAAACDGRLTEDWRRQSQAAGEPDRSDHDGFETRLPAAWRLAPVRDLADIKGGIQKQPKRAPKRNAYPYLRVGNVLRGRVVLDRLEEMELFGDELETYRLLPNDLLIVEGNGSPSEIGRSALWTGEVADCVHQNHIIRVRARLCDPHYLNLYWNSPRGIGRISQDAVTTTGLLSLSTKKIGAQVVPLPPDAEQREIVRRVEALFALADAIEKRVAAASARADKLTQAILAKAFRGELVPTEADLNRRRQANGAPAAVSPATARKPSRRAR